MFTKLFSKILDSSIWLEPTSTRIVWITLLAAMDEDGFAHFSSIKNLALRARVSEEEAELAIGCFTKPDPDSANPDNQGRRVERVPGGYFILNAEVHRQMMNREVQKEQNRIRAARFRERNKFKTWKPKKHFPGNNVPIDEGDESTWPSKTSGEEVA